MYEISTSKYTKVKNVLIDGKSWQIRSAGAGEELSLSQGERRLKFIEKLIESGKATAEDIDTADEIEKKMLKIFKGLFRDSTPDNSEVSEWVDNTSLMVIYAVLDEIKKQSEVSDEQKAGDKTRRQSESSSVSEQATVEG